MTTAIISDQHFNPGDIATTRLVYGRVIRDGDTLNLLPYGLDAWHTEEGHQTILSLIEQAPGAIWIAGNHDPLKWLTDLLAPYGITPLPSLDLTIEGQALHIEHGHRFAGDWRLLQHFAPAFVEWVTTGPLRLPWYRFCQWRGWIASGHPVSNRRLEAEIALIWAYASYEADRAGKTYVIGHTHTPCRWDNLIDLGAGEVVEL
jgi:predicted phosphodiesterase